MQRKKRATTLEGSPTIRPRVHFAGDVDHPDFQSIAELLAASAQLGAGTTDAIDVVIFAQSRPDTVGRHNAEVFRHTAPLAGLVAVVGTWCEGELRTGRPWPGVKRLYWYEFPTWWRGQLALRAVGECPDWARPAELPFHVRHVHMHDERKIARRMSGVVVVRSSNPATLNLLSDVLDREGFASVHQRQGGRPARVHGAVAGIWDGGQFDDVEAADLSAFSQQYTTASVPVIALLDFPRRDRVELALQLGATAVFAKPWINADLIGTLQSMLGNSGVARAA